MTENCHCQYWQVKGYRNTEAIEQMREDVETYEEAVRKQAALAEQARLKEQAAKEQESKAKSIKDKQQPKDNPNKKSKPWAYGKYQGKVLTLDSRFSCRIRIIQI